MMLVKYCHINKGKAECIKVKCCHVCGGRAVHRSNAALSMEVEQDVRQQQTDANEKSNDVQLLSDAQSAAKCDVISLCTCEC